MLYYLADYLDRVYDFPGAGVFTYISFRAAMAAITSLVISLIFGEKIITFLKNRQIGEVVRDLNLPGQKAKEGTPTMGGIIILLSIIIPTVLFTKLDNIYIILMLVTTVWLGLLGFVDDYIKVFKHDKKGLSGYLKVLGQAVLGVIVGLTVFFSPDIVIKERMSKADNVAMQNVETYSDDGLTKAEKMYNFSAPQHSLKTTIPFIKNHEFDYNDIFDTQHSHHKSLTIILFIVVITLVVTAVSNCCNLTDGLDGLAAGTSSTMGAVLAVLAWVSGNIIFADYLNIMMIPQVGELSVFIMAFVGACVGFLWYNTFPAQIFMGDTGSLAIGGIIAVFAILIRKEFLLPVICGIFVIEGGSVIIQRLWFKITKKLFGRGRRVFLMAPIHHHYQLKAAAKCASDEAKKKNMEAKIVARFIIVSFFFAVVSIITLKLR